MNWVPVFLMWFLIVVLLSLSWRFKRITRNTDIPLVERQDNLNRTIYASYIVIFFTVLNVLYLINTLYTAVTQCSSC